MKALEKDRHRRYETASAFAADLERYLHDEPVLACPPSLSYRLRKFVRRYRAALGTALLVLLVLIVGVVVSTWQAIRANLALKEAEANFRKARQAVDEQFTLVSESKLFDAPGFQPLQKDLLESALKYYLVFLQQRPADPELRVEVAALHLRLYQIREALDGVYSPGAMQQLEKGVEIVEQLRREPGHDPSLYTRLAGVKGGRAFHAGYSAPQAQAPAFVVIPLFQRLTTIWEDFVHTNPTEVGFQSDLSAFYFALQQTQASVGQRAEALANIRKALALSEKLVREHPTVAEYRAQLAATHEEFTWRLRPGGSSEELEYHFRRTLELEQGLANDFRNVPNYRHELAASQRDYGQWLAQTGRLLEAEAAFRQGLRLQEKLVMEFSQMPAYRTGLAALQESLGHLYRDTGQMEKAEQAYREAVKHWDKLAEEFPTNPIYRVQYSFYCLCRLLAASHRADEADRLFQKLRDYQPDTPDGRNYLAWELAARPDPRFSDYKRALELTKQAVEQAPDSGYIWNTLGLAQYRNGNWREAVAALDKSIQLGGGGDSFDRFLLAMAHWQLGNKDQARKWYSRAVQWTEQNEQHALAEYLREDLARFQDEAAQLLGMKDRPKTNERQNPGVETPGR
jgi:tetratricopeptide (TPR) repeat protein